MMFSQATIAQATGYSRRSVIRALQELYERGYIERWRRGLGDTNVYYINPLSFARSFRPISGPRTWKTLGPVAWVSASMVPLGSKLM